MGFEPRMKRAGVRHTGMTIFMPEFDWDRLPLDDADWDELDAENCDAERDVWAPRVDMLRRDSTCRLCESVVPAGCSAWLIDDGAFIECFDCVR